MPLSELKELLERRNEAAAKLRKMAAAVDSRGRDMNTDERRDWDAANAEYNSLTERWEQLRGVGEGRSASRQVPSKAPIPGLEDRVASGDDWAADGDDSLSGEAILREGRTDPVVEAIALQGWMRRQMGRTISARHAEAAEKAGLNINAPMLTLRLSTRALSANDLTDGASTIAPSFSGQLEKALLQFGAMRQVAEVIRTETGAILSWPTINDTSNEGRIVSENTATTDKDVPTDRVQWGAYKYTSDLVRVPVELLEDSAFDMVATIGQICGERIGRRQNRDFTTGDAAGKPSGIVTAAPVGVTAASQTAFTADELLALIHSVDPAYRGNARLMFNDTVLLRIRQLKDGTGRYLLQDLPNGAPGTVWGYSYVVNQSMTASLTANSIPVVFGDLSKYKIRDVREIRIRRLVERYADSDQEGFVAFMRSDGNLLNAGVSPVKTLKLAA